MVWRNGWKNSAAFVSLWEALHEQAVASAERLAGLLEREIPCTVFQADAGRPLNPGEEIDILITDVPYGELTAWESQEKTPGEEAGRNRTEKSRTA